MSPGSLWSSTNALPNRFDSFNRLEYLVRHVGI
jgi:hypothetical protein